MRIHAASLQYFDAVRRSGSIREASRRLNVASSAVNRQILKLEEEVGSVLFDRLPTGVRLTAAGEMLARHIIVVLQDFERARGDIEALKGARTGHVSIVAVEGLCGSFLPEILERMYRRAPRLTFTATTRGSAAIARAVLDGEADIGIAFDLQRQPDLRQVNVTRFKLGVVVSSAHRFASLKTISLKDCAGETMILPDQALSIRARLEPIITTITSANPFMTTSSLELMRELVERGVGIAFQTRLGLNAALGRGALAHIPLQSNDGPVWSELGIYVRAGRSFPPAMDLTLSELSDHLTNVAEAAC